MEYPSNPESACLFLLDIMYPAGLTNSRKHDIFAYSCEYKSMSDSPTKKLKAVADAGRLRVLGLIAATGELCVCEIEQILGLTVSTASRNLRDLEGAGWLASRREGRWIHYRLAELDPKWDQVRRSVLEVFAQLPSAQEDLKRRDVVLSAGRRALCAPPVTLEKLYEQLDQSAK